MNEENEPEIEAAVSEQPVDQQEQQEEQKMVPLAALEAERKKRQDSEAKAQLYQDFLMRGKEDEKEEVEDPNAIVEKKDLQQNTQTTKREILETLYQDMNPEAVRKIDKYLKPILEKKPWLAASVDTALNRYARAYEIVNDYIHLVEAPAVNKAKTMDGQRIVQNAQKPRSPAEVGKSAQPSGTDYLKSIQGKKEFREYRTKILRGEA